MIIANKKGKDILYGKEKRIAFAVNTEGINDFGFAGKISDKYWPELKYCGECQLGTVLTKETDHCTFYALVCHSLADGWKNQTETIKKCFDGINSPEPFATISIGAGFIGKMTGANTSEIFEGMEQSKQQIILY